MKYFVDVAFVKASVDACMEASVKVASVEASVEALMGASTVWKHGKFPQASNFHGSSNASAEASTFP